MVSIIFPPLAGQILCEYYIVAYHSFFLKGGNKLASNL